MTPPLAGPVVYLTGEYPRATDTFIQREVAALRRLGIEVHTCTIRATDPAHHVGEEQRAEHAATFPVQRAALNPLRLVASHAGVLVRRPGAWLGALGLALRTCPQACDPCCGRRSIFWRQAFLPRICVASEQSTCTTTSAIPAAPWP